jgi:hypothetical protein
MDKLDRGSLARDCYSAYQISRLDYERLPDYDQLPSDVRAAWYDAASTVMESVFRDLRVVMATMYDGS